MTDRLADVALDHQLSMLRWCQTDIGRGYMDALFEESIPGIKQVRANAPGSHIILSTLVAGGTYVVTSEILGVLDQAAETLPSGVRLHPNDLPTPTGFVWLEEPVAFQDINDKTVIAQGFMWNQLKIGLMDEKSGDVLAEDSDGLSVILLTCPDDPRDHMFETWKRDIDSRLVLRQQWPTYMPMICGIWPLDDRVTMTLDGTEHAITELFNWVAGFFFFINETWIDSRMFAPSRPAAKRAARLKKPEPEIKIVRLRRAEQRPTKAPSEDAPEWSHRWIVRQHWRHQWYPSENRHRWRLIPEYIKGPEDKPLIVHDTIFKVDR